MATIKKHGAERAPRGRQSELDLYSLRAPDIQEKLELFVELAAGVEHSDGMPAVELLQRLMSVNEDAVNSYKANLFEEAMDSLVTAEQRILELEAFVHALTQPRGRGHRRSPLPSIENRLRMGVKRAQWLASLDGEQLSQSQAVMAVLREIYAMDSNRKPLPEDQLNSLVKSKLESALRTYRRANANRPDK